MLGGVLTDYVHWTMIFWINLPLGLLALWMTDRALRSCRGTSGRTGSTCPAPC